MAAKDNKKDPAFESLKKSIQDGNIGNVYTFFGEERYLLEYYLGRVRKMLIPEGLDGFNMKRVNGKDMSVQRLSDELDALPVFCERTLIEVWDWDVSKLNDENAQRMIDLLTEPPEYVCVIFVYDTIEFKLDGRHKTSGKL